MGKKNSSRSSRLASANKKLALENASLAAKIEAKNAQMRNSFSDLVTGLGNMGGMPPANITSMDPMLSSNIYSPVTLMWQMLLFAYRTHGLLQTAIDQPVLDAMRGGLDLQSDQLSADDLEEIQAELEEKAYLDRITDAFIWARLFGGGALIVNSESDSNEPLGDEIMDGGEMDLYDACRWELSCEQRIPQSGKYGFYGKTLDASRVFTICGKRAPFILRSQLSDWGMSELERMIEDFNVFLRTRNVIYDLLDEAKIDVFQLEGFKSQLMTPGGTAATLRRIQTMNQLKNFNNALVLDKLDGFDQKQLSFGGIAEILKECRIMIASALRMPMTKLFGIGSTGFNSGEDDIENYNAMVESEVRQPMRPIIRKILKIVVQNKFGADLDLSFQFKPLRILGALDEEAVKSSKTNRLLSLYDRRLLDSKELGEAARKEDLVPIPMKAEQGLLEDHPAQVDGTANAPETTEDADFTVEKPIEEPTLSNAMKRRRERRASGMGKRS